MLAALQYVWGVDTPPPFPHQAATRASSAMFKAMVSWMPSLCFISKQCYPKSICYSYSLALGARNII